MTTIRWNPLRLARSLTALSALIAGCSGGGSNGNDPPIGPSASVFSSLSITPNEAVMCLVDHGNTVVLSATPLDQSGQSMGSLGSPSFMSSDDGAATVAANGLVRAIAAGTAQITASLTATGTTRTAAASITVASAVAGDASGSVLGNHPLPHVVVITAFQLSAGNPLSIDIQGEAFHSHTLSLTDTQVRLIAAGCRISQLSTVDTHSNGTEPHNHAVTFN